MNRFEYMTKLASVLQDISEEDRRDAMEYYNAYFDEAGSENEQKVIEELGDPVKLAEQIKEGVDTTSETEAHNSAGDTDHMSYTYGQTQNTTWNQSGQTFSMQPGTGENQKNEDHTWRTVLIVVVAILTLPITVPLILSILGTAFGILVAAFFIVFGLIVGAAAVAIIGVVLFGVGFAALFSELFAGLALAGIGLILAVVGVVIAVGMVYLCKLAIPEIAKGASVLWNKISHRGKAVS